MSVRRLLAIWAVVLFALVTPASAHRLDEYLQATTIAVAQDRLALRIRLTPGVSVAPAVLARIDADGDGSVSAIEERRYAEHAADGIRLTIDGAQTKFDLRSWMVATPASLRAGVGDIALVLTAPIGPGSAHRIVLDHPHPDDQAVYLVNTLVPDERRIHVLGQQRSVDQSRYQLDIAIDAAAAPASGGAGPATAPLPPPRQDAAPVVATFFARGVQHILTGYDHLLFVAALVLGAATLWDLVKVVTAFTIAHSITLALAALHLVHLPDALVEPVIATSIVAVAVQNIARPEQARGGSRLVLAFLFGLFHGLGFAGGLLEVMHGMSGHIVILAILGFSLGVEVGNQMVLLPLFAALRGMHWGAGGPWRPSAGRVRRLGSIIVAGVGAAYLIDAIATV